MDRSHLQARGAARQRVSLAMEVAEFTRFFVSVHSLWNVNRGKHGKTRRVGKRKRIPPVEATPQRQLLTGHGNDLRTVLTDAGRRRPFTIDAIVVLRDHLRCIRILPPDDTELLNPLALAR
jgi:hypothetical protein